MNGDNWRKSTYSGGQGGQCVEVGQGNGVLLRDSKDAGNGPVLRLAPEDWTNFLRTLRP